jgi:hypothetical protein
MAIVQAVPALILRPVGKLPNTVFGWATVMSFAPGRPAHEARLRNLADGPVVVAAPDSLPIARMNA